MTFIVSFIVSIVFTLMIGLALVRIQEARKIEAKNKSMNKQVRDIQADFRELVAPLYTDNIVNVMSRQRLTSIVSNFFVFQPVSEQNIERLLHIVESCRGVFDKCRIDNSQYPEEFPDVFDKFIQSIPISARDFKVNFYNIALPTILEEFVYSLDTLSGVAEKSAEQINDEKPFNIRGLNDGFDEPTQKTPQQQPSVH
ncbi:hypothetical protein [Psychrosphaera saromensis]|uniref:Uncharacterized protein n=1 Tax=Psychrosphaera saromensis TaxID=716813 RepID=A0A2S7USP0_9GAMM|nr:hypothetical protein [Psychrosphaera saromensis]PQJ52957.1 hypothetical protein BTO11_04335 [Psychrosphaera saromensis]